MDQFWEFMRSNTAPWWTALLGVIVGAVISPIAAGFSDRRRFRYEDRRRWDDQAKELCIDLRGYVDAIPLIEYQGGDEEIMQAIYRADQEVKLIGDAGLRRSMRSLIDAHDAYKPDETYYARVDAAMRVVEQEFRRFLRIL